MGDKITAKNLLEVIVNTRFRIWKNNGFEEPQYYIYENVGEDADNCVKRYGPFFDQTSCEDKYDELRTAFLSNLRERFDVVEKQVVREVHGDKPKKVPVVRVRAKGLHGRGKGTIKQPASRVGSSKAKPAADDRGLPDGSNRDNPVGNPTPERVDGSIQETRG